MAKIWKQPKGLTTGEWVKMLWNINTMIDKMDYCSVLKIDEILPFATTWKELEDIILREVRGRRHTPYNLIFMK